MVTKQAHIGEIVAGLPDRKGREGDILSIRGLGSCVGVVIYDPVGKVAALSHVALPKKLLAPKRSTNKKSYEMAGRYATTFIDESLVKIKSNRGKIHNLNAKIVGGAKMFSNVLANKQLFDLGARNVASVIEQLGKHGIKLMGKSVLGESSKTIWYNVTSQILLVKIVRDNRMIKI